MTTTHGGNFDDGEDWAVDVTRSLVVQAFDVPGLEQFEVCNCDGAIFANWHTLPLEMTREQAVAVSALVLEAAG